jgi:hypothetical protein
MRLTKFWVAVKAGFWHCRYIMVTVRPTLTQFLEGHTRDLGMVLISTNAAGEIFDSAVTSVAVPLVN